MKRRQAFIYDVVWRFVWPVRDNTRTDAERWWAFEHSGHR